MSDTESTPAKMAKLDDCSSKSPYESVSKLKDKIDFSFWKCSSNPGCSSETNQGGQSVRKRLFKYWDDSTAKTSKVLDLKPGSHGRTSVTVRVTFVADLSGRGKKYFRFHGLDDTGEIEFVSYENCAERLSKMIKVNRVYRIENFYARKESPNFPTGFDHATQVVLGDDSDIQAAEGNEDVPQIPFNFVNLDSVHGLESSASIDFLGIIVRVWEAELIKIKGSENTIWKRDLSITDRTRGSGVFTIWGTLAEKFSTENLYKVLALRRAKVNWIGGLPKLTTSYKPANTLIWIDPDITDAATLMEWFEENRPDEA